MAEYRVDRVDDGTWRIVDSRGTQVHPPYETQAEARQEARKLNDGTTTPTPYDEDREDVPASYPSSDIDRERITYPSETRYPGSERGPAYTDHDLLRVMKVALHGGNEEEQRAARETLQRIEDALGPEPEETVMVSDVA